MGQAPSSPGRAVPYDHSYFSDPTDSGHRNEATLSVSSASTPEHVAHTDSTLTPSPDRTPLAIRRHEGVVHKTGPHTHGAHNGLEIGTLSYMRQRRESESTTSSTVPTTTSSAVPADTSIPTVTEFSDLDTLTDLELDFIQSTLDYPRIKTYSPGPSNMDLHVGRYDSKNKPGESSQARATAGTKSPKPSKETRKTAGKKSEKKTKKVGRRISETSSAMSESSGQSSKAGGRAAATKIKRVKSNEMKKRAALAQGERKDSLANRWQHMVDEYQDVYVDHDTEDKQPVRNERKVSKISDYGKYDKVRQVFNKGYALPMQKAPPGLRVDDLESESAPSEASLRSWNAMSPGRSLSMSSADHRTQDSLSPNRFTSLSPDRKTSRDMAVSMQHNRQREARRHTGVRSSELMHQSHMVHQEQSSSASPPAVTGSTSQQQSARKHSTAVTKESRTKTSGKKKEGMQDRATDIVDTVIENALKLLYGSPRTKRKSSSASALSTTNVHNQNISRNVHNQNISRHVDNQNISRHVDNQNLSRKMHSQNVSRNVHDHNVSRNVHDQNISRNMHDQNISRHIQDQNTSRNLQDQNIVRNSLSVADSSLYRTTQYGADWDQGNRKLSRSGSHASSEQYARRPSHIKVVPRSGQRRQSSAVRVVQGSTPRKGSLSPPSPSHGVYRESSFSLDLQPYNAKLDQVSESDYTDRHAPSFSDSEYATTLEIRKSPEPPSPVARRESNTRVNALYATPAKKTQAHQRLPPTLTRGTVTRVLHDGGTDLPGATEFIASLKSQSQPSLLTDYTTTKVWPIDDTVGLGKTSLINNPSNVYNTMPSTIAVTSTQPSQPTTLPSYISGKDSTSTVLTPDMYAYHGPSQRPMSFLVDTSNVLQNAVTSQPYVTSGLSASPSNSNKVQPQPEVVTQKDLPPIVEVDESQYGVFSNEPIIVADLMQGNSRPANHIQMDPGTKFYGTQPAINMSKRQQLNFYVFNQTQSPPGKTDVIAQDVEMNFGRRRRNVTEDQSISYKDNHLDFNDSSSDDTETEMREVTLYHKQTQTPSVSGPPSLPRRIKKEKKVSKRVAPAPPIITRSKPSHKETTHYITQQTEIEKLSPDRTQVSNSSVQTDFGTDLPDWPKEPQVAPPPPLQRTYSVESSLSMSPVPRPIFTETREMEQYREVRSPSPVTELKRRDIPVIVLPKPDLRELSPSPEQTDNREIVVGHVVTSSESSEEEMEILETMEIEEKEQRIAMAIFEEIEFQVQRTQGGNTVKESMNAQEIAPFWIPDKYEAIVDRRRQKIMQVKETSKEGQQSKRMEQGFLPALQYEEASSSPRMLEDRTMTASKTSYVSDEGHGYKSDSNSTSDSDVYRKSVNKTFSKTIPVMTTESVSDDKPRYRSSRTVFIDQSPTTSAREPPPPLSESNRSSYQDQSKVNVPDIHVTSNSPGSPENGQLDKYSFMSGREPSHHREVKRRTVSNSTTYPAATKSSNCMRVSKYDPENVSFGKKSGQELLRDADEVAFDLNEILQSAEIASQSGSVYNENDHTTASSGATVLDGQVVHCSQSEPQLKTRIEKDGEGNLVKITEMQHTLTKTVEYPGEGQPEVIASSTRRESLQAADKVDNDIDGDADDESTTAVVGSTSVPPTYTGPEVVGETSVGLKPYEYGTQTKSVKVQDVDNVPTQLQYLYDMKTTELSPVQTKDRDYNLLQYSVGDTMFTQL